MIKNSLRFSVRCEKFVAPYADHRRAGFRRELTVSAPGFQGMLDFLSETIPEAKKTKPAQFFADRLVKQLNAGI